MLKNADKKEYMLKFPILLDIKHNIRQAAFTLRIDLVVIRLKKEIVPNTTKNGTDKTYSSILSLNSFLNH